MLAPTLTNRLPPAFRLVSATEPVDTAAAENYAVIASSRERAGKPITSFDALIAAVCRSQGAALATRNVSDFEGTGIEIIDPWGANRDSI